jgi:O-phospho-L-seryl-tRNASec:L-selenocysteinyl-tRNA synthase
VSGARTIKPGERKDIGGVVLEGFGSSCKEYPDAYLTAAVAIGMRAGEGGEFLERLDKVMKEVRKKEEKAEKKRAAAAAAA